jgi:hypothetical protein
MTIWRAAMSMFYRIRLEHKAVCWVDRKPLDAPEGRLWGAREGKTCQGDSLLAFPRSHVFFWFCKTFDPTGWRGKVGEKWVLLGFFPVERSRAGCGERSSFNFERISEHH